MNITNTIAEAARELACFEGVDLNLENAKEQLWEVLQTKDQEDRDVKDMIKRADYFSQMVLTKAIWFKS